MNPQPSGGLGAPGGSTASGTAVPVYHRLPIVLLAVVVCCPFGIVLLWQSRRRPAAVAAGMALVVSIVAICTVVAAIKSRASNSPTFPAEDDTTPRQRGPARERDATPAEALAAEQDAAKAERAKQHAVDVNLYRVKTAPERLAAVRQVCPPGRCDRRMLWIIVESSATDAERARLNALADAAIKSDDKILDARAAADEPSKRTKFAKDYDQQLLDRGMNPDAVRATGPANKTLHVRAWFCSRQFAHDFDVGPARAAGFTRFECSSGAETVTMDL